MSGQSKKWSTYWAESMASVGFVVVCDHFDGGLRFRIIARDSSMALSLLYNHDLDVKAPLDETAVWAALLRVGLSEAAIDATIGASKDFTESVASRLGPIIRFSH
jgi:hypothetical protein